MKRRSDSLARSRNATVMSTATNTVVASVRVGNFPHSIAFGTVQEDSIESLIERLEALITGGTPTQNQGDGLIDKLEQAGAKIDAGQTSAACNQLSAFINQVTGLINIASLIASSIRIVDPLATAGGTDPIQERFLTLQQSRATYKNRRAFRRSKDSGAAPRLINVVAGHVGTR
jgi:hypothetical protein